MDYWMNNTIWMTKHTLLNDLHPIEKCNHSDFECQVFIGKNGQVFWNAIDYYWIKLILTMTSFVSGGKNISILIC